MSSIEEIRAYLDAQEAEVERLREGVDRLTRERDEEKSRGDLFADQSVRVQAILGAGPIEGVEEAAERVTLELAEACAEMQRLRASIERLRAVADAAAHYVADEAGWDGSELVEPVRALQPDDLYGEQQQAERRKGDDGC